MELEEAISKLEYELDKSKIVKKYQGKPKELFDDLDEYIKSIETVLNHLTKQEKMIELMADMITELKPAHFKKEKGGELAGEYRCFNKKEWKQYFEKKVGESE